MQLELLRMLDHHRYALAVAYAVASVLAGYLAIHIATSLVRRVRVIV
jgi:CrcB protein